MVIQEMTEQECRAMLVRMDVARLACARNSQPYLVVGARLRSGPRP